ncbi:MAG: hypothetical protein MN733_06445 [Nitrososphaera sp.]|nr:hypothetical protein [Nitrososphaera sp.]
MTEFKAIKNVTKTEIDQAMLSLSKAIAKKDTFEEWASFAARTTLLIGKIMVAQLGYGPAIELIGHLFGDNKDVIKILEMLLKEKTDA